MKFVLESISSAYYLLIKLEALYFGGRPKGKGSPGTAVSLVLSVIGFLIQLGALNKRRWHKLVARMNSAPRRGGLMKLPVQVRK